MRIGSIAKPVSLPRKSRFVDLVRAGKNCRFLSPSLLIALLVFGWALVVPAASQSLTVPLTANVSSYDIGDRAREDIMAPEDMAVTDYQKTDRLRQEASRKVAPIFRYDSEISVEAEKRLRESVDFTRMRFAESLLLAAKRPRLTAKALEHPSFGNFVKWFENQHPQFPVSPELARLWATQEPDDSLVAEWINQLRNAMNQCVFAGPLPSEMKIGPDQVRVVPAKVSERGITLKVVDNQGVNVLRSNMVSIAEARRQLLDSLGSAHPQLGSYLGQFLVPNCFPEEGLTRELREANVDEIWAVDHYEKGQLLVGQGHLITPIIKAALDAIASEDAPVEELESASLPQQELGFWSRFSVAPWEIETMAWNGLWIMAGLSVVGCLVFAVMVRQKRLRTQNDLQAAVLDEDAYTVVLNPEDNETVFLPGKQDDDSTLTDNGGDSEPALVETAANTPAKEEIEEKLMKSEDMEVSSEHFWKTRAMEAERKADQIFRMVRAGLAPQLARQMMSRLVQELLSQRADWMRTQEVAEFDLSKIEQRFVKSHELLQERLKAFEKRADELERALELKTEENSELIKAHIALVQDKLKSDSKEESDELPIWN